MTEDETITNKSTLQVIEYISGWKNLKIRDLNSVNNLGYQLGRLIAFDLFIGNSDWFLYATRLIENEMFINDPSYMQMNPWNYLIANLGNIVNIKGTLYSIDARPFYFKDELIKYRQVLKDSYLIDRILDIIIDYFELTEEETKELKLTVTQKLHYFQNYNQILDELIEWCIQ